jgi:hypothetical protein
MIREKPQPLCWCMSFSTGFFSWLVSSVSGWTLTALLLRFPLPPHVHILAQETSLVPYITPRGFQLLTERRYCRYCICIKNLRATSIVHEI